MASSAMQGHTLFERVPVKPWRRPPPTSEDLDWAPLAKIDLSRFDEPGGKEYLAKQLYDALTRVGFWVVVGHGIDDERVLQQFSFGTPSSSSRWKRNESFRATFPRGNTLVIAKTSGGLVIRASRITLKRYDSPETQDTTLSIGLTIPHAAELLDRDKTRDGSKVRTRTHGLGRRSGPVPKTRKPARVFG
ncbi:hypothetical protein BDW66DRAFT_40297 [Aspergillus desertorum]